MEGFGEDEIESILWIGREVYGAHLNISQMPFSPHKAIVYKIPPLKANEGHRAQEWGDLSNPLWKGRIRIIERSAGVSLQFEDATTGKLAPYVHCLFAYIFDLVGERKSNCR